MFILPSEAIFLACEYVRNLFHVYLSDHILGFTAPVHAEALVFGGIGIDGPSVGLRCYWEQICARLAAKPRGLLRRN